MSWGGVMPRLTRIASCGGSFRGSRIPPVSCGLGVALATVPLAAPAGKVTCMQFISGEQADPPPQPYPCTLCGRTKAFPHDGMLAPIHSLGWPL
jgi:hypothetical protein